MTRNTGRSASRGWRWVSLVLCLAGTPVLGQAGPLPELEALRQSLKITASLKESRYTSGSFVQVTCLAYHLEASLSNKTPYSFELGHEMVLLQSAINGVQYCGCFIEKGASSHPSGIELDQWPGTSLRLEDYASTDGATTLAVAPGDRGKSHPKGAGYGKLEAGEAMKLAQMFHLTRGFKPEARGTIRITLPELIVSADEEKRRFMVQLTFDRTRALQEQQIIPLDEPGIAEWLNPRHATPQLILAANWLACSDAAAAGKRLPALADERPGTTYTVAHLLGRLKSPSFTEHAQRVVADPSEDPGARSVCLKYLAVCDWKPAVPAVLRAAAQDNPEALLQARRDLERLPERLEFRQRSGLPQLGAGRCDQQCSRGGAEFIECAARLRQSAAPGSGGRGISTELGAVCRRRKKAGSTMGKMGAAADECARSVLCPKKCWAKGTGLTTRERVTLFTTHVSRQFRRTEHQRPN